MKYRIVEVTNGVNTWYEVEHRWLWQWWVEKECVSFDNMYGAVEVAIKFSIIDEAWVYIENLQPTNRRKVIKTINI